MFTHTVAATDRALSDAWLLAAKQKAKEELEAEEPDDDAHTGATDRDVQAGDAIKAFMLHQQGKRRSSAAACGVTKLPVKTKFKKENK